MTTSSPKKAPLCDLAAQACSFLFVPATQPERLPKALASGADMVIADWEDAVAPADKPAARSALLQAVAAFDVAQRARLLVRIDAEGSPWFADDLDALTQLMSLGLAGAVVPKAERLQTLCAVAQAHRVQQALQEAGGGVCVLDGHMVDAPVWVQARHTLQRHARAQQRSAAR